MIEIDISKRIFNSVYLPYIDDNTRTQIFFGGSSSGKSKFLSQRAILDVLKGRNYLIVRNTKNTIRTSTFNEILKIITKFKLYDYFFINKTDFTVTCKINEKQIIFAGLDDVQKLKSVTPKKGVLDTIWIEEATEAEWHDIKELQKRLRGVSDFPKRIIFSFNPILQSHWLYKEYFNNWDDTKREYKDENLLILKTTYKDNTFLEEDDIKALEDETDKYYYNVYTLGNWGVLGSVIFKNWTIEDCSEVRKIADNFKNGLDFGYAKDPSALIHTHYDRKKKTIYILDEFYKTELTNDLLAIEIKKIIGNQYVNCDSAEPKSIYELRQHQVNSLTTIKGKDSVNHGIQWLQQQKIVIDIHCQNFRNEIQQYKWEEDRDGNVLSRPVDKNNHGLDALRYAYESEFKQITQRINLRGI
jgi:phage terminase large subunit